MFSTYLKYSANELCCCSFALASWVFCTWYFVFCICTPIRSCGRRLSGQAAATAAVQQSAAGHWLAVALLRAGATFGSKQAFCATAAARPVAHSATHDSSRTTVFAAGENFRARFFFPSFFLIRRTTRRQEKKAPFPIRRQH